MTAPDSANRCYISDVLIQVISTVSRYIKAVAIDNRDAQLMYALAFYLRILELTETIATILRSQNLVAIPILFRSIYEAHIDLNHLLNRQDYLRSLCFEHLQRKKKVFEYAQEHRESRYHARLAQAGEFKSRFDEIRSKIQEMKDRSDKFTIEKKLADLGRKDEYRSVYAMLSQDTHNDMRILESRHFFEDESGMHLEVFKETPLESVVPEMASLVDILKATPDYFETLKAADTSKANGSEIRSLCDILSGFIQINYAE